VSESWYYKWRDGDVSTRRERHDDLAHAVLLLFHSHQGTYGSPRIHADLVEMGWKVSKNSVAAAMAEQSLVARPKRRRRGLTKADQRARKAPDLVGRQFAPTDRPDEVWVGDLTEVPTGEGPLYLAVVLDLFSRRAVGWALGAHHDDDLSAAALKTAVAIRGGDVAGVVFHSDQGGEYTGATFVQACTRAGVMQSMGRTGSALDNAVAESFNSTFEFELLAHHEFATHRQARAEIARFMDRYNHTRRHSTAQNLPPAVFEQQFHTRVLA
jgi:transposase InsO family protein